MTEGRVSAGFLRSELYRLVAEEEQRKKEYFEHRSDLQEVWDKLTSLRTHINKLQLDIENAKIEEIMRDAGSLVASSAFSSLRGSASEPHSVTLESSERAAIITKLKDKVRMKDVLQARVSSLEEKIVEGRKQLFRVAEALKSAPTQQSGTLDTSVDGRGDNSVSRALALRQAILTISDKVNTWEDELVHARSDLKAVQAQLADEISILTDRLHPGSTQTRDSADGPAGGSWGRGNSVIGSSSALQTARRQSTLGGADDALIDIATHGPPLSASLSAALRTGGPDISLSGTSTFAGADAAQMNMLQECEFSVYEVLSGQAAVHRINGEAPALYIMRLQRRLGSLLTLELQIQLEFQAKLAQIRQSRDLLRDVEVKRLRVELQVSNINHALQSVSAVNVYQPSTLSTPYASAVPSVPDGTGGRDSANVDGGLAVGGSHALVRLESAATATPAAKNAQRTTTTTSGIDQSGRGVINSSPKRATQTSPVRTGRQSTQKQRPASIDTSRSPPPASEARGGRGKDGGAMAGEGIHPERGVASSDKAAAGATSPQRGQSSPTLGSHSSSKAISFRDSTRYASQILQDILQEQTLRLTAADVGAGAGAQGHHGHLDRKAFGKSPSTKDIHRRIMEFMRDHHLDPHTHYAGIIKAIKIQVLSQLLSRDMSQHEVHDTAMLMAVTSPSFSATKAAKGGSQRAHKYFGGDGGFLSPIPMAASYQANTPLVEGMDSAVVRAPSSPHSPVTASAFRASDSFEASDGGSDTDAEPLTPHSSHSPESHHHQQRAQQQPHHGQPESGKKFRFPDARRDAAAQPSKRKAWVAGGKQQANRAADSSAAASALQIQRLAAKALQTAVSALSETFKEDMLLSESGKGGSGKKSRKQSSPGKTPGEGLRRHSSFRSSCSCESCRTASMLGESTDDYEYQSGYDRHGRRIAPRGLPKGVVQGENDGMPVPAEESPSPTSRAVSFRHEEDEGRSANKRDEVRHSSPDHSVQHIPSFSIPQEPPQDESGTEDAAGQPQFDSGLLNSTVFDVSMAALSDTAHDAVLLAPSPVPSISPKRLRNDRPASGRGLEPGTGTTVMQRQSNDSSGGKSDVNGSGTTVSASAHSSGQLTRSPPARAPSGPQPFTSATTHSAGRPSRPGRPHAGPPAHMAHTPATRWDRSTNPHAASSKAAVAHSKIASTHNAPGSAQSDTASTGRRSPPRSHYCAICLAVARLPHPPGSHATEMGPVGRAQASQCLGCNLGGESTGGEFVSVQDAPPQDDHRALAEDHPDVSHSDIHQGSADVPESSPQSEPRSEPAPDAQSVLLRSPLVAELGKGGRSLSRGSSPTRGASVVSSAPPYAHPSSPTSHRARARVDSAQLGDASVGGYDPPTMARTRTGRAVTPHTSASSLHSTGLFRSEGHHQTPFTPYASEVGASLSSRSQNYPPDRRGAPEAAQPPTEYAQLLAILERQQREIDALRSVTGVKAPVLPFHIPRQADLPMEDSRALVISGSGVYSDASILAAAGALAERQDRAYQSDGDPLSVHKPRLRGSRGDASSSTELSGNSTPYSAPNSTLSGIGSQHGAMRHRVPLSPTLSSTSTLLLHESAAPAVSVVPQVHLPSAQPSASVTTIGSVNHSRAIHSALPSRVPVPLEEPAQSSLVPQQSSWSQALQTPLPAASSMPTAASTTAGRPHQVHNNNNNHQHHNAPEEGHQTTTTADTISITSTMSNAARAAPISDTRRTAAIDYTTLSSDPTVQAIVRCLSERIARLTQRWEQARATETLHPEYGVAVHADGSSKAYVDVTVLCGRNLPHIKRLTRSCDAYTEIMLCTHFGALEAYQLRQQRLDGSTLPPGRVHGRTALLTHLYGPHSGVNANYWNEYLDDTEQGLLTNGYCRTAVKEQSLFPEWREHFHFDGVFQPAAQGLLFVVRDAAGGAPQTSARDTVVGYALLPLSAPLLRDQHPHHVWLPLHLPVDGRPAQHRLHQECAIKVEVKVHVSEQRYWADLRAEAEQILQKVQFSLTRGGGAGAGEMALTPAEGRRLEKWLDAMAAGSTGASAPVPVPLAITGRSITTAPSQGSGGAVPSQAGLSLPHRSALPPQDHTLLVGQYLTGGDNAIHPGTDGSPEIATEREVRDDTTADAESDYPPSPLHAMPAMVRPLPPLPAQVAAVAKEMGSTTVANAAEFITPAPTRHRRHLVSSHRGDIATSAMAARYPKSSNVVSTAVSTAEKRPPVRRFLGLREENNRDVFLKSLRSDATPAGSSRTVAGPGKKRSQAPEPLPYRVPTQQSTGHQSTGTSAVTATPPPLPVQMQRPAARRIEELRPAPPQEEEKHSAAVKAAVKAPPPLPVQVQQHSLSGRVDLSIFKRAGSDPIYQGEVRQEVGQKLQHRAELTSEKVGFLSGGLRRLKF